MKRCMNCGKPFSVKKSKIEKFCSVECRKEFNSKQKDDGEWMKKQNNIDFQARKKAKERDFRYQERRI